jgi:hypothetical protein
LHAGAHRRVHGIASGLTWTESPSQPWPGVYWWVSSTTCHMAQRRVTLGCRRNISHEIFRTLTPMKKLLASQAKATAEAWSVTPFQIPPAYSSNSTHSSGGPEGTPDGKGSTEPVGLSLAKLSCCHGA